MRAAEDTVGLYKSALQRFEGTLVSHPNNRDALLHCALIHFRLMEIEVHKFDSDFGRMKRATENYFQRVILVSSGADNVPLLQYAKFCLFCGDFEAAEQLHLLAIERQADDTEAMKAYAVFLTDMGQGEEAAAFYKMIQLVEGRKREKAMESKKYIDLSGNREGGGGMSPSKARNWKVPILLTRANVLLDSVEKLTPDNDNFNNFSSDTFSS